LAQEHEESDQPRRGVVPSREGRDDPQGGQLVHVRLTSDQALKRVPDHRQPQQDGPKHGEDVGIEALLAVDRTAQPAVDQEHPAGQRAQKGQTHPHLLAMGVIRCHVLFEMEMIVCHRLVARALWIAAA